MINPLDMTVSDSGVPPMLQQLAKQVDTNHDGKVSGAEFAQFLTNLMGTLEGSSTSGTTETFPAALGLDSSAPSGTTPDPGATAGTNVGVDTNVGTTTTTSSDAQLWNWIDQL